MKFLNQCSAARSRLEAASTELHDARATARPGVTPSLESHAHQPEGEGTTPVLDNRTGGHSMTEQKLGSARSTLDPPLNRSNARISTHELPPEILAIILNEAGNVMTADGACGHPIGIISLVCVQWREIALRTPSLWSHIVINIPEKVPNGFYFALIKRVGLHLQRSNGIPIRLYLREDLSELCIPKGIFIAELVVSLQSPGTSLERLAIGKFSDPHLAQELLRLKSSQTSLNAISISHCAYSDKNPRQLSWPSLCIKNLTELTLSGLDPRVSPDLSEIAWTLVNSPALHTLRLDNISPSHIYSIRPGLTAHLPFLKRLHFGEIQDVISLIDIIHPGAEELDLQLDLQKWPPPSRALLQMFQPLLMRSNVVSLTLREVTPENTTQLPSYLSHTPKLRALFLSYAKGSSWTDLNKIHGFNIPRRLPHLQSLGLTGATISRRSLNQIRTFASDNQLRNLVFISCDIYCFHTQEDHHSPHGHGHTQPLLRRMLRHVAKNGGEESKHDSKSGLNSAKHFENSMEGAIAKKFQRIENVVACDTWPGSVHEGKDWFIQRLTKVGSM